MDIICARCGKHFSSIEAAREHRGNCRETSSDEPIRWVPARKSKITPAQWENLMRLINTQNPSSTNVGPTEIESEGMKESVTADKSDHPNNPPLREGQSRNRDTGKNKTLRRSSFKTPIWVIALLFIFALSLIGVGISIFSGIFVPFWILFSFSLIFSIEKWFFYWTRKHKSLGKLYRLFLNLVILSAIGVIIWSGIKLFSGELVQSSLIGSVVFLGELVFFVWMWRVVSRNSWRWPSMKLTVFSLLAVSIIFAFARVRPLSDYKTTVSSSFSHWMENLEKSRLEREAAKQAEEKERVAEAIAMVPATITEALPKSPDSTKTLQDMDIRRAEESAFTLINMYRQENGIPPTVWDDRLYELSKAHTQEMARRGELFHGLGDEIGENAWGGRGYYRYDADDLAMAIVASWSKSPLHNAWLLHAPIKESVVSIVVTPDAQYASWSFWMNKLTNGPELVAKVIAEWKASGSELDWIPWLKSKGYLK